MTQTKADERRQYPRYPVQDTVFVTFNPDFTKLGRIKDISKGGIAFEYILFDVCNVPSPQEQFVKIDIFKHDRSISLSEIPCKIIYDVRIKNDSNPFSSIETRCTGLQFNGISEEQSRKLQDLINIYMIRSFSYCV